MMTSPRVRRPSLYAIAVVLGLAGCGSADESGGALPMAPTTLQQAGSGGSSKLVTLPFDAANFVARVDNRYFPLTPGAKYTYHSEAKDGNELNVVEVLRTTKRIVGVTTTVVHDQVFIEDGSLLEDTFDWYAQDKDGNVWYFGEDTKEYDHGVFVTDQGSWEAGKNGARPGLIMLANPQVGDMYKQEDSPGVVEDMGKVISLDEIATVEFGTFTNCLVTTEWTPIEPGNRSHKFYAPGIGLVLEVASRQGGERVELVDLK